MRMIFLCSSFRGTFERKQWFGYASEEPDFAKLYGSCLTIRLLLLIFLQVVGRSTRRVVYRSAQIL